MSDTPMSAFLPHRRLETDYLSSLNDRFASYISKVHLVQEQTKSIENATLVTHVKMLTDEMNELKLMYEDEIGKLRSQLDETFAAKNAQELSSNKHIVLSDGLEKKLLEVVASRKKLEAALSDSHRLLTEKDAVIASLHISLSEEKQANADLARDKSGLQAFIANLQEMHDQEATKRTEVETKLATLQDKYSFDKDLFNKEVAELKIRVNAANMAIAIAEERLKEHDIIDDQLAAALAKVKLQSHSELLRFQEEAEYSYLASLTSVKNQLDQSAKAHAAALEDNINLKARLDDLTGQVKKEKNKCDSFSNENKSLIHTLELERNRFSQAAAGQETSIRQLREDVNTKCRELGAAYNSNIPVDVEIEAFSGLLDAEEKRLQLSLTNPAPEIISRSMMSRPTTSRVHITRQRSDPIGVAAPPQLSAFCDVSSSYSTNRSAPLYPQLTPRRMCSSSSARATKLYNLQKRVTAK